MSYYPIELDKTRNLRYNMRAIDLIETKFKKPLMDIEGIRDGNLTMREYATFIWAGLAHEDKGLTPDKIMDLIDEHSTLKEVSKEMWSAFNEMFAVEDGKEEEEEEKNK